MRGIAFGWMYRYSHEDLGYASFDEFLVVTFVQQLVFGLVCMPLTNPCLLKLKLGSILAAFECFQLNAPYRGMPRLNQHLEALYKACVAYGLPSTAEDGIFDA